MKMFLILVVVCLLIAWSIIVLSDRGPDKPSLIINKIKIDDEKYIYVAFKANKKSPWRRIGRYYKGKVPTKKEMLQFSLDAMTSPRFRLTFEGSEEEWGLMYNTIKNELSNI